MKAPHLKSVLAAPVAALLVLAGGCGGGSAAAPKETSPQAGASEPVAASGRSADRVELSPRAREAIGLRVIAAQERALGGEIRATAVIKPNEYRMAHVSPRIPGKAIAVEALLGDVVSAGAVLAELDSIDLGEKKATFLQSRANLEVARRNYRREERLYGQHISSEKEYLEAKGEIERNEAAYRAAREALRLVGLSDDDIEAVSWSGGKHPLSHFPLLAPFAGTIIERHITIGELIEPNETPYTIADLITVWVLLDIYEKDLARVHVGDQARIGVEAYPGEVFTGKVTYLSSLLDPSTRTAQARVEIDSRDGRLRPGMFATAAITGEAGGGRKRLVIPRDAVQHLHGKTVAFVQERPGTYSTRELSLGAESGDDVEVLSGIAAGEPVVTEGAFYLKSALLKEELGGED